MCRTNLYKIVMLCLFIQPLVHLSKNLLPLNTSSISDLRKLARSRTMAMHLMNFVFKGHLPISAKQTIILQN